MNKKISILTLALMLGITSVVSAKENCCSKMNMGGGYVASQADISTIKAVQDMEKGSYVTLQGQIIKRINKNKYQFKDQTGTMMVKIGKKIWRGLVVSAEDTVQISGKVEKSKDATMLDVKSLIKQ